MDSWFIYAFKVGQKYDTNIRQVLQLPWPKLAWKTLIKKQVIEVWRTKLLHQIQDKSTLKMMIPGNTLMTKPHPLWEACKGKTFQVKAATARARMLVGRFQLQTTRARFSKVPMSMECPICETEDEDIVHFLCRCPKLEDERHQRMKDFKALFTQEGLEEPRTDEELASALLNGGIFRVLVGSRHKYSAEGQPMVTKSVTLVKNMVTAQQLPNLIQTTS